MKLCKLHKGDKKGSIFLKKLYKAKFFGKKMMEHNATCSH